jgi:hypothetical protein
MTRRVLAVALTCAWAVPALAATYSVSPTGTGSACTPGSPCALATANAAVQPGDLVLMANGTYTTAPIPARSGTASARIEYRGNPANKNLVVVPTVRLLDLDYVTYRYFRVNGGTSSGFRLDGTVNGWRLGGLTVIGDFMLASASNGQFDSVAVYPPISGSDLAYNYFVLGGAACPLNGGGTMSNTTFRACSLYVRSEGGHQYCFSADPLVKIWGAMKTGVSFIDNKFLIVMAPGSDAGSKRGLYLGNFQNCTFRGNKWVLADSANVCAYGTGCITARIRDYFLFNTFTNDTFYVNGSGAPFYLSSQGDPNDRTTEGQNKWKDCVFKSTNGGSFDFNWGIRGDTLQGNVFVSNAYRSDPGALRIASVHGGGLTTVIDHNTFYSAVAPSTNSIGGLNLDLGSWGAGAALKVTNNIFYRPSTATTTTSSAARFKAFQGASYTFDNNLFAYYGGNARSINYQYNCPSCTPSSGGLSAPGTGGAWYSATGQDGASFYGSPLFVDSSFTNFDPRLRVGSPAIGRASDGSDVGAVSLGAVGPDVTPPAPITDLATTTFSDHMVALAWTVPGDDGMSGAASAYDMRRSAVPITDQNFSSATPVTVAAPWQAGFLQATVVEGLNPGTTYYFAIKTRDESGNWSSLGNVLATTTDTVDRSQPRDIGDLTVEP